MLFLPDSDFNEPDSFSIIELGKGDKNDNSLTKTLIDETEKFTQQLHRPPSPCASYSKLSHEE